MVVDEEPQPQTDSTQRAKKNNVEERPLETMIMGGLPEEWSCYHWIKVRNHSR